MTLNINENIPGWNGKQILNLIAEHASLVPDNGTIVELGALFGRSTYALGHNKKESVKLFTIDIWTTIYLDKHPKGIHDANICGIAEALELESNFKKEPLRLEGSDYYKLWKKWTSGIHNLIPLPGRTSQSHTQIPLIDFIYHDANHTYDGVKEDLKHWWPKLKVGGILIIDDYERQFVGLVDAVNEFVQANNLGLETEMLPTNRNLLLRKTQ